MSQRRVVSHRPFVLHVIDSLDSFGGAERQLATNLRFFDKSLIDHEVAVIVRTSESRVPEIEPFARVHTLLANHERPTRRRVALRLRALAREREPQLIHASLPDPALAARFVAATTSVRAVESLVNISHEPIRAVDNPNVTPWKLRLHTVVDRVTMGSLSGYHAVSQAVADSWVATVGLDPERIEIIPRGVEHDWIEMSDQERIEARRAIRHEFGMPSDAFLLLAVGRVEPQKGHRYLIEALRPLAARHENLRCLIVGREGVASPAVEGAIREAGLRSIVTLTGARRNVPELLAAADTFVFPSLFEGNGGNAMIEAMAAGLAVVTTNAAPMTDLIPDSKHGMLVDRYDSSGLSRAIETLIREPALRQRLGAAARKRAATFPTPEEAANRHEDWYLRLLSP